MKILLTFISMKRQEHVGRERHACRTCLLFVGLRQPMSRRQMNSEGVIIREELYLPRSLVDCAEIPLKYNAMSYRCHLLYTKGVDTV